MQETKRYFLILAVVSAAIMLAPAINRSPSAVEGARIASAGNLPLAGDRLVAAPQALAVGFPPELQAAAAYVKDLNSQVVLFEKQALRQLPPASLTKLMTALVAAGMFAPDEDIVIAAGDLKVPEARAGFVEGERLKVWDLLQAMLVASANDAAMALARAAGPAGGPSSGAGGSVADFVAAMNAEAAALGMSDTHFTNPAGLDDGSHYSTARDLGLLVEEFLRHPELAAIAAQKTLTITSSDSRYSHRLATTNKLLLKDPDLIGLKTGYTDEARGNLILLTKDPVMYSILLGSDDREGESERLLQWIRENFTWR